MKTTRNQNHAQKQNPESEWFGREKVSADEKTDRVLGVFDSVANKYDLMNDLMSGGIHRLWKNALIKEVKPHPAQKFVDVAGGTGDIAFRIREAAGLDAQITVADINENMLNVGRNRSIDKGWLDNFEWITTNAESLPFSDNSFDVYTISFGLRNVTHIDTALKEAFRVLKPGGRFFCLEFSHVTDPILARFYDFYSYKIIPKIGEFITKDRESYQYLVDSIRKFPKQDELRKRLIDSGFAQAKYKNMTFGTVAIHEGIKDFA